ncbi:MAG: Ldh family oxidoreductase [Candidatus Korobacteraceae bacterium]
MNELTKDVVVVQADALRRFGAELFEKTGMKAEEALINADNLVDADLKGIDSHGSSRLPLYLKRIRLGVVRANCEFKVLSDRLSAATLDACNSMGAYVSCKAMDLALDKAAQTGVAMVSVGNSNHNGCAGYYAERALRRGMIGIVGGNSKARMAPWGGRDVYLGTNPIAVAIPTDKQLPVLADLATSIVARGKLVVAAKKKQPIPPGWALNKEGEPTTDPAEGVLGSVMPAAGAKGSALALVIDVLSSVLSGSLSGPYVRDLYTDFDQPACVSHVFGAINIEAFTSAARFRSEMDRMITEIKNSRPAKGVSEIFLPGEKSLRRREKWLKEGIPMAAAIVDELKREGEQSGVRFPI